MDMEFWAETKQQKVVFIDSAQAEKAKPERRHKINGTVIPARRKTVKRMIFKAVVDFFAALFSRRGNQPEEFHAEFKTIPMMKAPSSTKVNAARPFPNPPQMN